MGKLSLAEKLYKEGLALDPHSQHFHMDLINLYSEHGKIAEFII